MPRLSTIPQELIDSIIDQIPPSSATTLKRTSNVSRAFLSASQRRLFHTFTFRITSHSGPYTRTNRLLAALTSNPSLARHVRSLTIIFHDWSHDSSKQDHFLPKLLRLLTHVGELTVEYDPTTSDASPFPISITTAIRNVLRSPTLHIARFIRVCPCRFDFAQLRELAHLRSVEFVGHFHAIKCTHDAVKLPNVRRRLSLSEADKSVARLETLSIGGLGVSSFVESLLQGPFPQTAFSRLRELKIYGWRHDVFESAWEVMKLSAETLESVVFYWPYGRSYRPNLNQPLGPIDLTALPHLHTVIFYVPHVWVNGDHICLWYPWLSTILSSPSSSSSKKPSVQLLPPTLRQLGLAIETDFDDEWIPDPDAPQVEDTGRTLVEMGVDKVLDEGLKKERYPHLERVHIELLVHQQKEVTLGREDMRRCAPKWFPRLSGRGILSAGVSEMGSAEWAGRFEGVLVSPI